MGPTTGNIITPADHLTLTEDKILCGGKSTETYRGQRIYCGVDDGPFEIEIFKKLFTFFQTWVSLDFKVRPVAINVLSSETKGQYIDTIIENPSPEHGIYAYVQFKLWDPDSPDIFYNTDWGCMGYYSDAATCASRCAYMACLLACDKLTKLLIYKKLEPKAYIQAYNALQATRAKNLQKHW